jgi:alkylation response protein AidB-like acyl-CoA dehydrogenase
MRPLYNDQGGRHVIAGTLLFDEHNLFRDAVRKFFDKEVTPFVETWEREGLVPKSVWKKMGEQGFLCPWLPEEFGGTGADFLYSFILTEELARTRCGGFFFRSTRTSSFPTSSATGPGSRRRSGSRGA